MNGRRICRCAAIREWSRNSPATSTFSRLRPADGRYASSNSPSRHAECTAGLRDLVLVMGKDEIDAAAVNVEAFAKMLPAHRRALEMPAGTAPAPGAVPGGLVGA